MSSDFKDDDRIDKIPHPIERHFKVVAAAAKDAAADKITERKRGGRSKRVVKAKGKVGRPKIEFDDHDWDQIEQLCKLQCGEDEIAGVMRVSISVLSQRIQEEFGQNFKEFFAERSVLGKVALRRSQYRLAVIGHDGPMLKWLGQQMLGQRTTVAIGNEPGVPFKLAYSLDEPEPASE